MLSSLRNRILLLIVSLLVAMQLASIAGLVYSLNEGAETNAARELNAGSRVLGLVLGTRAEQLLSDADIVNNDRSFIASLKTTNKELIENRLRQKVDQRSFDVLYLLSGQGKPMYSSNNVGEASTAADFNFAQLLPASRSKGSTFATVIYKDNPYLMAFSPINDSADVAWVVVGVRLQGIYAQAVKEITGLDISIVRNAAHDYQALVTTGEQQAGLVRKPITYYRQELALSSAGVENIHDVYAVLETSDSHSFKPYEKLRYHLLVMMLLGFLASILVAIRLNRWLNRPIAELIDGAERISRGEYDAPIEPSIRVAELSILAAVLNKMRLDISAREKRILYQSDHDVLTGLPNRTYIHSIIDSLLRQPSPQSQADITSILRINIEGFKQVNDTFGYKVGDLLLREVAVRLLEHSEKKEYVARISGDEFILIYTQVAEADLLGKSRELQLSLQEPFEVNLLALRPIFRIGIVIAPKHGTHIDQLLRRSDIAMHQAKTTKQECVFYEVGQDERHLKEIALIDDLKIAIDENQLILHFQPKWDLQTGTVVRLETLVRWKHPRLGFIPPDEFIPLAERSGIVVNLSRWVIKEVIAQWRGWKEEGRDFCFAVNISAHDIAQKKFPCFVAGLVADNDIPENTLNFEITESAVMEDPEHAIQSLCRLRALGCSLSLDDFGTGFSSLSQIKSMPVDELKIDKSFILNLENSLEDQTIVQATVQLAHSLGMRVVAEGVETLAAWELLESYGCEELQGYYITKPLPADELVAWYDQHLAEGGLIPRTG